MQQLNKTKTHVMVAPDSCTSCGARDCIVLCDRPISQIQSVYFNILKPTGHVMQQQFNIQQLYVLPTLYLCVLYLSENKQRLVPLTA